MKKTLLAIAVAGALAISATAQAPTKKDIVDTAVEAKSFTTLVSLVKQAGLVETLKGKGPFTVFAPTDAAFKKLPKATLDAVANDKELLKRVLLYHVVPGKVGSADVVKLSKANTALKDSHGKPVAVAIKVKDGKVWVGGSMVTATDIETSNGVIHVVDTVIIPPSK